jgi:two-component system sensor histidine kinase KdpD
VRLDSGGDVLNKDWHALPDLIGLALQRYESRLAGWHVSTDVPGDLPILSVDGSLMVQLLSNLLENAIKYTPPGTRIFISAYRRESTAHLVVEDSGPGFGSLVPELLFDKFTKVRTVDSVGGVGLGLAICRIVARLHGGDIWASPRPGAGARFEIALPIPVSDPYQSAGTPSPVE